MSDRTFEFIEKKYADEYRRVFDVYDSLNCKVKYVLFVTIALFIIIINNITLVAFTPKIIVLILSLFFNFLSVGKLFYLMKSKQFCSKLLFFNKDVLIENDVFSKTPEYISEQLIDDYDKAIKDITTKNNELFKKYDLSIDFLYCSLISFVIFIFL